MRGQTSFRSDIITLFNQLTEVNFDVLKVDAAAWDFLDDVDLDDLVSIGHASAPLSHAMPGLWKTLNYKDVRSACTEACMCELNDADKAALCVLVEWHRVASGVHAYTPLMASLSLYIAMLCSVDSTSSAFFVSI